MEKTNRPKTLEILKRKSPEEEDDGNRRPIKLSFEIQKAPERKKLDLDVKKSKRKISKKLQNEETLDESEEKKAGKDRVDKNVLTNE